MQVVEVAVMPETGTRSTSFEKAGIKWSVEGVLLCLNHVEQTAGEALV